TYVLLPRVKPGGDASGASSGPGGKRMSLIQWGAYVDYFKRPGLAPMLWQFLSFCFGFSMFIAGMPLVLERRLTWNGRPFGPEQVGYTWALAGFLGIFLQGPALGRLVKRFGERALNRVGFGGYIFGYAILAFCHSIPVLILATVVTTIGGLVRPNLTSMITHTASREEQGVVL